MTGLLAALLAGHMLGVGLSTRLGPAEPGAAALGILCLALLALGRRRIRPWLLRGACALGFLPLAMIWTAWRMPLPGPNDPVHEAPLRHAEIVGTVASDPRRTERGLRFEVEVESLQRPVPSRISGRILVRAESREAGSPETERRETANRVASGGSLRYGQRVRLRGSLKAPPSAQNPGEFDYREYLARSGIFAVMNARAIVPLAEDPPPSLVGGAIAFKNEALALLSRHLPQAQAALLGSLLFGDGASPIDPETAGAFRALGLAHVLAVSGAQILFLWGMLKGLITAFGIPRWLGVALGCAGLWGYALMTGLPPSVVRATWMGCALIVGWAVARPWLRYLTLEAVVLGMLLARPSLLFDVGFQFSAIATFSLLHTTPILLPLFKRLPETLAQAVAMALAAGLWVLPLQIFHFGQFSPYSLPLNAVTCFLVEAMTIIGFVAVLGGALSDLLGHHLLSGAYVLLRAFVGIVELTLPLPGSSWYLRLPPAAWLALAYVSLAGGMGLIGRKYLRLGGLALMLPVLAYAAWDRLDRPRDLSIVMLSIGHPTQSVGVRTTFRQTGARVLGESRKAPGRSRGNGQNLMPRPTYQPGPSHPR